jgi:tetratricopeptide (TPR) repeat protein
MRLRRWDEAIAHARLGESNDYSGAHLMLAHIAMERKQYDVAEEEAKLALRDGSHAIDAQVLLARAYSQQNRPREALAAAEIAFKDARRLNIGKIESLHYVVGDALARMQQYDKAEAALKREIELFPDNQLAYSSLYLVYVVTNRPADANAVLESMVRVNPNRAAMLYAAETTNAVGDTAATARWRQRAAAAR